MVGLDIKAVGSRAASPMAQEGEVGDMEDRQAAAAAEGMGCRMVGIRGKATDTTLESSSGHGIEEWNTQTQTQTHSSDSEFDRSSPEGGFFYSIASIFSPSYSSFHSSHAIANPADVSCGTW